ncbi:MAG: nitronate monooxygenase family protein [Clostridiales bacterium]|nr:nitronate monooxygenase family protein [Clostridiales bacterium]
MAENILKIGDLTLKHPIIQGGMGVGVSRSRLAGAVAREGGMGIISTAQIGYDEPDFYEHPMETNLMAVKKHLKLAREEANGGVVGFNIMVATRGYEQYVRTAAEAGADTIISGAGLPVDLPAYVAGTNTKIAPIVSSEKAAKVILKFWDRKYKRTADFIVIEGPKAGGHLGFSREQLDQLARQELDYEQEIGRILTVVKGYEEKFSQKIPVVLAGGIFDHSDVQHALQLGADGVQIATRFVATKECDAADAYKQAYIDASEEDICIVDSPVGMPGRAVNNNFLKNVAGKEPITNCTRCLEHCNPAEAPYCITKALIEAVKGNLDQGLIFCGSNVGKIHEIVTVKELMQELCLK